MCIIQISAAICAYKYTSIGSTQVIYRNLQYIIWNIDPSPSEIRSISINRGLAPTDVTKYRRVGALRNGASSRPGKPYPSLKGLGLGLGFGLGLGLGFASSLNTVSQSERANKR